MNVIKKRMKRELEMLEGEPPPGISCWSENDDITNLKATIVILDDSPYKKGLFHLSVNLTSRYPFEPPVVKFITPIYHPNIDSKGLICLDLLKLPPRGNWKPSQNISSLLQSIQILVSNPNLDDPLMVEIANEFRTDKQTFINNAKMWTMKYASDNQKLKGSVIKRKSESCKENEIDEKKIRSS